MNRPRIASEGWEMTMKYRDSYGEELWTLEPFEAQWIAVIHVESSGKIYLSIPRDRKSSKNFVNQDVIVAALQQLCQKIYEERGITCIIGVPARNRNAKLFSTVRKAGFHRSSEIIKNRKRPVTIIFKYFPEKSEHRNDEER